MTQVVWRGTKDEFEAWKATWKPLPPIPRLEAIQKLEMPLDEAGQEGAMLWALERLDEASGDGKAVRGVLGWARTKLSGERLAVVEETAAILSGKTRV